MENQSQREILIQQNPIIAQAVKDLSGKLSFPSKNVDYVYDDGYVILNEGSITFHTKKMPPIDSSLKAVRFEDASIYQVILAICFQKGSDGLISIKGDDIIMHKDGGDATHFDIFAIAKHGYEEYLKNKSPYGKV